MRNKFRGREVCWYGQEGEALLRVLKERGRDGEKRKWGQEEAPDLT